MSRKTWELLRTANNDGYFYGHYISDEQVANLEIDLQLFDYLSTSSAASRYVLAISISL